VSDERLHADACRIPADRRSFGDRLGRRTIYLIGIAWFALTSAACGFAPDVVFLITTRALQGAGAAC
jgi:MFS family permease